MASQRLPGPHSGVRNTLTKGDPLARSMGQYGKGHDPLGAASDAGLPSAVDEQPPALFTRGGAGGIRRHPKFGEMGPGADDGYGSGPPAFGGAA